jgi:cyclophilin family peptidyl-prolyl cis-trans isomerase
VQKGFALHGGDWKLNNGRGGHSSFGVPFFQDENFIGRHSAPGVIAMANSGVHTNSSVFYITLAKASHLGESNALF